MDFDPGHGDLPGPGRLLPILGEGRRRLGGVDAERVAGGGRGREALGVDLVPGGPQAVGDRRGSGDLAVGEQRGGADEVHLREGPVAGELLEADGGEVQRVAPLGLDEVEPQGDGLGLLGVAVGGDDAEAGERRLRAGDQGLALGDHLFAAGADLLGRLPDARGGGGGDDALAGLGAGHALFDQAHGVAPLGKLAGPEVTGHLDIGQQRRPRGGFTCGDDEKGGEQGEHGRRGIRIRRTYGRTARPSRRGTV